MDNAFLGFDGFSICAFQINCALLYITINAGMYHLGLLAKSGGNSLTHIVLDDTVGSDLQLCFIVQEHTLTRAQTNMHKHTGSNAPLANDQYLHSSLDKRVVPLERWITANCWGIYHSAKAVCEK